MFTSLFNCHPSDFDVVVWDSEEKPIFENTKILFWRQFVDDKNSVDISIPELIEENADTFKSRYLAWLYEISMLKVSGKYLIDYFKLYADFNFWWLALINEKSNYSKSPNINDAIRLMAYAEWAKKNSIAKFVLFTSNISLARAMRRWSKSNGIIFSWRRTTSKVSSHTISKKIYHILPYWVQSLVWINWYVFKNWGLRGLGLNEWKASLGKTTFISYFCNLDLGDANKGVYKSNYWANLPEVLRRDGVVSNWLHLNVGGESNIGSYRTSKIINAFNRKNNSEQVHVILETFLGFKVIIEWTMCWLKLMWLAFTLDRKMSKVIPCSENVNLWPLFVDEWRQSLVGPAGASNLIYSSLFKSAFKLLKKQNIGVYLLENQAWEFGFIQAWKASQHSRLVGYVHSSVRFWDLRYFFDPRIFNNPVCALPRPDLMALNGLKAIDMCIEGGYSASELVGVEALRYLHLNELGSEKNTLHVKKNKKIRLLVLGDYSRDLTLRQIRMLEEAVKLLSFSLDIIIKPHPACTINRSDFPRLNCSISKKPIPELLSDVDLAYAGVSTSAALDVYLMGISVVSRLDPNVLNLSPLRGSKDIFFARSHKDLAQILGCINDLSSPKMRVDSFFILDESLSRWRKLIAKPV
jgi:surface carbohydrate biosynthesis protein (TIGR04326 family)